MNPHLYTGWFSATLDTFVNYLLPSRITGVLTILSCAILSLNWSNCLRILQRDYARTASPNAGWSIFAMAGGLGVTLEKPSFYTVEESSRMLEPMDIARAQKTVQKRVEDLTSRMENQPKSMSWKVRARLGEKKQSYELPERDKVVDSRISKESV